MCLGNTYLYTFFVINNNSFSILKSPPSLIHSYETNMKQRQIKLQKVNIIWKLRVINYFIVSAFLSELTFFVI